jgi:hypothetical protein
MIHKVEPNQSRLNIFDERLARISLFVVSVLIAIVVMPLADLFACNYLIFDYAEYIRQAWMFPVYLFSVLGSMPGFLVGWLIYLVISFSAIFLNRSGRLFGRCTPFLLFC